MSARARLTADETKPEHISLDARPRIKVAGLRDHARSPADLVRLDADAWAVYPRGGPWALWVRDGSDWAVKKGEATTLDNVRAMRAVAS